MQDIWNIQLCLFSLVILIIIYTNIDRRKGEYHPDQRLYHWLLISVMALLVLDFAFLAANGRSGWFEYYVNLISSTGVFLIQMFPCFFWYLYTRYQLTMDMEKAKNHLVFLLFPIMLNTILVLVNIWFPIYFFIDEGNCYHRADSYFIAFILTFFYYLYTLIYIFIRRKQCEKWVFLSLLLFALPPFVGSVLQMLKGYMLIWPGAVLSLLLIYLNIQRTELYTDYLTGLYNRRFLDIRLTQYLRGRSKASSIGVLMLDVDRFKHINDKHGHTVGDQALIEAANVITKSLGRRGFAARYGGDEYVVVVPGASLKELETLSQSIEENARQYYSDEEKPYCVSMSVGYADFTCDGTITAKEVFEHIDRQMYLNKHHCACTIPEGKES